MEKAAADPRKRSSPRSEDDFRSLADAAPMFLWAVDADLNVLYVDKQVLEYAGVKKVEDYTSDQWMHLIHPDDYPVAMKALHVGMKSLKPFSYQARLRHAKTGKYHWFYIRNQPYYAQDGSLEAFVGSAVNIDKLKAAEAELASSEEQFSQIFNHTSVGISKTTLDGKYVLVNQRYADIMGRTKEELLQTTIRDTTHPEDYEEILATRHQAVRTGSNIEVERRYVRPDGTVIWTSLSSAFLKDAAGKPKYMLSMVQDITERKLAQEALRERELQLEAIVNQTTAGIIRTDLDGTILYVNKGFCEITGRTPEELYKITVKEITPPEEWPSNYRRLTKLIKDGKAFVIQKRYIRPDGSRVWVRNNVSTIKNEQGKPVAIMAISVNIDDQERATQALQASKEQLRQSEEHLRFMAESMPQKVFAAGSDGRVDYLNPQWAQFSGLPLNELLEQGWLGLIHPNDARESLRKWEYSINTGEPFEVEHRFRRYDGVYRWHISRAHAMHDKYGQTVRWFGSHTDIEDIKNTLQRKNELETTTATLKRQRTELVSLNRAKDEFISLASHQLRTPASGVKQLLGMLLDGFAEELSPGQRKLIERANESNERQIAIINDLLRVAQVDAGKVQLIYQTVNLVTLVREIIQDQSGIFISREQDLHYYHANEEIIASLDVSRIRMVIENLLDNASKYTYPGKKISVTVSHVGQNISIAIADQGVGIAKRDLRKLFHKFSRLDNALSVLVGGTGLGLYWAHKIVELHGGVIEVDSDLGKGTTFTINMPIDPSIRVAGFRIK